MVSNKCEVVLHYHARFDNKLNRLYQICATERVTVVNCIYKVVLLHTYILFVTRITMQAGVYSNFVALIDDAQDPATNATQDCVPWYNHGHQVCVTAKRSDC